ncbi:MAG: hypothetical protein DHS20C18_16850 [Saprospiraceae bacterium]|nr:MAG: hypothetical protein DHS20C18_16850 [Saprospiraceae bacterium]
MKQYFSLLFFLLGLAIVSPAQSFRAYLKAGDQAIQQTDYFAAMHYYENALERKPDDLSTLYKMADAARHFNSFEMADKYYQKVLKRDKTGAFSLVTYWLGFVKKQMGAYEEAKAYFQQYLEQAKPNPEYSAKAKQEINNCEQAIHLLEQPAEYQVERMDKKINTAYSEFGAYRSGDTLFYSSYRFDKKSKGRLPERKISKVLMSIKGGKGRTMRRNFNEDQKHTAHTAISTDQSRIYYTLCDFVEGSVAIRCQLFYREKDSRKRWKSMGLALPSSINIPGYTITQPAVAFDSLSNTEILYYVSDRPGGKGGKDIWWVQREIGKNKFSEPQNLEQVNTPNDEITPFFHAQNQHLYFSSDGYNGLGGFDIYRIAKGENWGLIEPLAPPINSSYNDIYYFLNEDGKTGYLSSNRLGSLYLDQHNKTCCNDIYTFKLIPPIPETPIDSSTIVYTPPEAETSVPELPKIPETLEDFLPLALYFDNDEPDRRTRRPTTRKNYELTYQRYYDKKKEYQEQFARALDEDDQAEAEALIASFFEEEVKQGYDFLFRFSEILLKRLLAGDEVEIFIKGYTSPRAQSDYNLSLGQRRISSLRNHFSTYQDGVFVPFLDNGQLVITERSFGETTASQEVSDDLTDLRNSIYSPAAARERRVEILEVKRKEN